MDGGYELTEIMVRDVHAREILYRAYGCGGEVSEAGALAGNRFAGALAGNRFAGGERGLCSFPEGATEFSGFGGNRFEANPSNVGRSI